MSWPAKSPDLNPINRNWDAIGRVVRRRGLANVRRFSCKAISNGRMERNYTAHVECLKYMYVTLVRRVARPLSKRMAVIPDIKSNEFVL